MDCFRPMIYQKSIFEIDYAHLKELGITCLIFDLDNTIGFIHSECSIEVRELIKKKKKDFLVIVCSNNTRGRIQSYLKYLDVDGVCLSMKRSALGLVTIMKRYQLQKSEMCLIGDQMLTDILAGNRFHIMTVLVDPLGEKDLKVTEVNRMIENKIIKKYQKKGIFERGKYYE